jgi:hypothetical protein
MIKSASELTEASQELIDAVFRHNGRKAPRKYAKTPSPRTPPSNMSQAAAQLDAMLSHIDPDCGYEDWLHVLMAIFHNTGGSEEGLALADSWSSRGSKYPGEDKVRAKWRSFESHTATPVTIGTIKKMLSDVSMDWIDICAANEPQFAPCEFVVIYPDKHSPNTPSVPANPLARFTLNGKSAELDAIEPSNEGTTESEPDLEPLTMIQRRYALINMTGRLWVLDQQRLKKHPDQGTANKLALSNRSDGALLITRAIRAKHPQEDASKIAKVFFSDPETTCYDGVEFNPAGTSENHLNLWVGPTIKPKQGVWVLIKAFIFHVICGGDEESYLYLIRYIAHALQCPSEKPGVIVILLGGQGTGKGTLGRILRLIWGATFLQVHNIDTVTGNFNASLERAYIVFLDEALFVGNRRSTDALKSLVTEPVIQINEKHQPARQINSYHRFIAATNADHMKHTEKDDRRDFVLRVSEERKGDHEYWRKLNHEIDHGGAEAMVHDMLVMDLSDFNVRDKPETKELLEQKLRSLEPIERWWHDCLHRGGTSDDGEWPDFISTDEAIEGVMETSGGRLYKKPAAIDVRRTFKKICPSASVKQQKTRVSSQRQRGYALPSVEQARKEFEQYIGGKISW